MDEERLLTQIFDFQISISNFSHPHNNFDTQYKSINKASNKYQLMAIQRAVYLHYCDLDLSVLTIVSG